MTIRILTVAVILCILFGLGCTNEKPKYDAGIAAYEREHYQTALYDFELRAKKGDPVAQFCLGFMYKHGQGIIVNDEETKKRYAKKAEEWYTKAAEQGYQFAQNNLGVIYERYMEEALEKGMENGLQEEDIKKIRGDSNAATRWLQKVALEQNNSTAQYNLALGRHAWAIGMDSLAKTFALLSTDDREKLNELWDEHARFEEDGGQEVLEILKNPSAKAVEAYEEAVSWYTKASDNGYPPAQNKLGNMYERGIGVDENLTKPERWKEAVEWYEKAAKEQNAEAQNNLGRMYERGIGIDENLTKPERWKEAVEWYEKAAKQGFALAQFNLGKMYYDGKGVDENLTEPERWKKAVKLYKQAAKEQNAEAQNNLAAMYWKGEGVDKNLEIAARWYFRSAQQGQPVAQENLGRIFEAGLKGENREELITKDNAEAYYWYSLASDDNSNTEIVEALERIGNQLDDERKNEIRERVKQWKPRIRNNSGTGFHIDENHILTNAHVARYEYPRNSGKWHKYDELRVGYRYVEEKSGPEAVNHEVDLALLYDDDPLGNIDTFATFRSDPVALEEDIVSFGYPMSSRLSYDGNVTPGIVSGLSGALTVPYPNNYFQHTAPTQGAIVVDLYSTMRAMWLESLSMGYLKPRT